MKTIKYLSKNIIHYLILLIGVSLTSFIQYSFINEVGNTSCGILSCKNYQINIIAYIIGTTLFILLYNTLWKKWIKQDAINNFKINKKWSIIYIIILLIELIFLFITNVIFLLLATDLFSEVTFPGNITPLLVTLYALIYSIVDYIKSLNKKEKINNILKIWKPIIFHEIITILLFTITTLIQFVSIKKIKIINDNIYTNEIMYQFNLIAFILSLVMFITCYNILWKKWKKQDLINIRKNKINCAIYIVISLIELILFIYIYSWIKSIFINIGSYITFFEINNRYIGEMIPFMVIVYVLSYSTLESIISKNKDTKN